MNRSQHDRVLRDFLAYFLDVPTNHPSIDRALIPYFDQLSKNKTELLLSE